MHALIHSFNCSLQHKYGISNNIFGTSQSCSSAHNMHTHKGRSLSMNPILLHGSSISLWLLVYTEQLWEEEKIKVVKKMSVPYFLSFRNDKCYQEIEFPFKNYMAHWCAGSAIIIMSSSFVAGANTVKHKFRGQSQNKGKKISLFIYLIFRSFHQIAIYYIFPWW